MLTKGMSQDAVLTQMLLDPGSMAVDVEDVDDEKEGAVEEGEEGEEREEGEEAEGGRDSNKDAAFLGAPSPPTRLRATSRALGYMAGKASAVAKTPRALLKSTRGELDSDHRVPACVPSAMFMHVM